MSNNILQQKTEEGKFDLRLPAFSFDGHPLELLFVLIAGAKLDFGFSRYHQAPTAALECITAKKAIAFFPWFA